MLSGPDLTLRLRAASGGRRGIVGVELRLQGPGPAPGRRVLGPHVTVDVVSATAAHLRVR